MISTKMSEKKAKEYTDGPVSAGDAPAYSWGTSLCLDTELLKKLGIEVPPEVGKEFTLTARCVVTGTSQRQQQDGDKDQSLDLQITEMELAAGASKTDAETFYGA